MGAPTFRSALTFQRTPLFHNLIATLFNQLILLCMEGIESSEPVHKAVRLLSTARAARQAAELSGQLMAISSGRHNESTAVCVI